jgi:RecA-family ATPase
MMSDTSDLGGPIPAPAPAGDLAPAIWGDDLERVAGATTSWLWDGYLARGNVTLLTSQWKSGKTTLLSVLLARRESGGQLAGRAVAAGRTAIVSEESPVLWNERRRKLGFGPSVGLLCRPFAAKPTREEWLALIDRLTDLGTARGVDLAVIDALATFLPGRDEANAGAMLDSLLPLQRLTERGMAVLLLHHPSTRARPSTARRPAAAAPWSAWWTSARRCATSDGPPARTVAGSCTATRATNRRRSTTSSS